MRDVFFTILVIWVLWRIFSGIQRSRGTTFTFNTFNNNPPQQKNEGNVTIKNTPPSQVKPGADEGEYVDFEEIKNK